MKKFEFLKRIDNFAFKKGGLVYRIWFVWKGTGKFIEDTGAEAGYLKRRFFRNF